MKKKEYSSPVFEIDYLDDFSSVIITQTSNANETEIDLPDPEDD